MENRQIISQIICCHSVFDFLQGEIFNKNLTVQGMSIQTLLDRLVHEESKKGNQYIKSTHPYAVDAKERIRKNLPRLGVANTDPRNFYTQIHADKSGPYLVNHAEAKRFPNYVSPESTMTYLFVAWLYAGESLNDAVERCRNAEPKSDNGGSLPEPAVDMGNKTHGVASVTVESSQAVSVTVSFN